MFHVFALYRDADALERSSQKQRDAYERIRRRCSVNGCALMSDGSLEVGFESILGRDRTAIIGAAGQRLETRNTYAHC